MVVLRLHGLMLRLTTLIIPSAAAVLATDHELDSPGCLRHCEDVDIPYPFGITGNCSLNDNFLIHCDNSSGHLVPFIGNLTVRSISVEQPQISILFDVAKDCYTKSGEQIVTKTKSTLKSPNSMFSISTKNVFTIIGCESYSYLTAYETNNESIYLTLSTTCRSIYGVHTGPACSLPGCTSTDITDRLQNMTVEAYSYNRHNNTRYFNNCTYAFVVEQNQFSFSRDYVTNFPQEKLPLALDWSVSYDYDACGRYSRRHGLEDGSGYYCQSMKGFQGNPYLNDGCQDINECENLSLNNCSEIRYCVNKQESYTCSCPFWFKGDGRKDGTGCKDQLPGFKIAIVR
ncbi:wall-associated receptor kinase 2 [Ziziphus jujuba]|uniref:Wall-associated receptor kinase 2 n=1 Tax=Ziziphus jujuba TaxID=326968 RepID=A0ABM4A1K2_ZIZJJ|nr:wall-associated receptor kinase 2 [Ziziphus jujuba]